MEILAGLLLKLAPYLIVALGILGAYFGIKRKGALQEREKWQQAQAEAQVKTQKKVAAAESKDAEIDAKVRKQIESVKKTEQAPVASDFKPGDSFKF